MKKTLLFISLLITLTFTGCKRDPNFITNKEYRSQVHNDFKKRTEKFNIREEALFNGMDTLKREEREALEFLYAYMPYSDLADYNQSFYLNQIRTAFEARNTMSWGKTIPEDIFRHFVLVYRVNNENLDTARQYMYGVLKDRVKGMSMEDAALEVNHWCHEHVAYRASDIRTSSPLATLKTSLGRCGEESTFTVTAMRSVGIPARQCYTPRWAHCDDNHAWVEVWVDGEWKFLGACEPDPRLNMGWFAIPSTRCMMVHSKVFGRYEGDEEVMKKTDLFSELNLLSHYAPTRKVTITVTDEKGKTMEGVEVDFRLYNYSEFYPLSTQKTNSKGQASLTTGLGNLLIWANNGTKYAFNKIDVRKDSTMTLIIGDSEKANLLELEMIPPAVGNAKVIPTEEEIAINAKRFAYEDSLRAAYISTFPKEKDYKDAKVWKFIKKSEGNYEEISTFINKHYGETYLFNYLTSFSDKDMRDITAETLEANYINPKEGEANIDAFIKGVLPSRVSNEMVRPFREELSTAFKNNDLKSLRKWTIENIKIDDFGNYYNCPISPLGVYKLRYADSHSRDIFYVAACRSIGVPAYLDNATNEIFVYENQTWNKVVFTEEKPVDKSSTITLTYKGKDPAKPIYWPHFTLQKLEKGRFVTFDFENDPRMEEFPASLDLDPGTYCLSTGNRYPDGKVRSRLEFFTTSKDEKATKEIIILPLLEEKSKLGNLDINAEVFKGVALSNYSGKTGFIYLNLGDYKEPSKHLIQELLKLQKEMKTWGGKTYMIGPNTINMQSWNLFNTDFAYNKGILEENLLKTLNISLNNNYPFVVLISPEGNILYHSEGYKIGVIEQILKKVK